MIASFGARHWPAFLIPLAVDDPTLIVTRDGDKFIFTDGNTIWNIDGPAVVRQTKITR